jgi:pimeloyl-ACP methyl ester carboxylesterase
MKEPKKKTVISIGIILFLIFFIGVYFYNNITYIDTPHKAMYKVGFVEKQVTLGDGTVINYGEGPDNGRPPLLLLHGQGLTWEDYAKVLPELSRNYHIFAVDMHGHGESSKNPEKYSAKAIGQDFIWFIENVIKEPVIASGHSTGGLMTAWLAANSPQNIRGIAMEDSPFFSTEPGKRENTYIWIDVLKMFHEFSLQREETDFLSYYLKRSYWKNVFGEKLWNRFTKDVIAYRKGHPNEPAKLSYLPPAINRIWESMTYSYDRRFGETFYDYSWFEGFNQAETLSKINCKAVFIKATTKYDKNGILLSALNDEQANRVIELIKGSKRIDIEASHDIHYERPKEFIKILNNFASGL